MCTVVFPRRGQPRLSLPQPYVLLLLTIFIVLFFLFRFHMAVLYRAMGHCFCSRWTKLLLKKKPIILKSCLNKFCLYIYISSMYLPTLEPALVYIMTYCLIFYYLYIIRYIIILYAHDDVLNTYIII